MFTDADSNMRGRLGTKWCRELGIQEGVTPTTNSGLESKAESSVRVQEKNGHLQLCILYVMSSVGLGCRDPQFLGNHSSDTQDTMVKHPRLIGKVVDDERTALWPNPKRCINGFALQNVGEVPLGQQGIETMGYVPVHQKL
jgi:hypothetical protein